MLFRFLSLIFILCSISNVNAAQYNSFKKKLSNSINTELNKFSIPGAAYVVVKDDKVIAIESFGYTDKTNKQKINENTVFRLASVSKPFAATIATMLSQEKKLNLSDPITKFLPNFALASKGAAEKIQLTHLLSHSTGLMPNAYDNLLHENWSMAKIISRFDRVTPICQPAKCYGYQNIAYGFLQPAIEAVTKRSYASLLQERVFTPLKMDNASVGIDVFLTKNNTAQPHILRKRVKTGKKTRAGKDIRRYVWRTVNVEPDYYKVAPAAGVNASITDLSKWLIANLGNNPEVLSPALLSELTTPRIKTKKDLRRRYWREHLTDAHYGYGWRIYQFAGHPIIYHSGWVAGYRADIGYSPTLDIGFAILINAESNVINKISSDFWTQAQHVFDNVD
jgi:beta-lactamase class C